MPKRKDSARKILIRHKDKVLEMWTTGSSMKDIHLFLLEEGEDIGYHQIREVCISLFKFNTKVKGSFIRNNSGIQDTSNSQPKTEQRIVEKEGFTYNPKAPDARSFWED